MTMVPIRWQNQIIQIEAHIVKAHGLRPGDAVDFPTIEKLLRASLQVSIAALKACRLNQQSVSTISTPQLLSP